MPISRRERAFAALASRIDSSRRYIQRGQAVEYHTRKIECYEQAVEDLSNGSISARKALEIAA